MANMSTENPTKNHQGDIDEDIIEGLYHPKG